MALTPVTSSSASPREQFTIASAYAGSGGTVYTVPSGKSFTGYFYLEQPNNGSYTRILINGSNIEVGTNTTYGTWYAFPIYLTAGDVVSNSSTSYFVLTGYEE